MGNDTQSIAEKDKTAQPSVYAEIECELYSCRKPFTPKRARDRFHTKECRIEYYTPVMTKGKLGERYMAEDMPLREAVLRQIVRSHPLVPCAHINIPIELCTSGRNRLAELAKDYGFNYKYTDSKPKRYDFSGTEKAFFEDILKKELAEAAAKKKGFVPREWPNKDEKQES